MGVPTTTTVGSEYDTLFHAADQALYTVKQSGRGQFRFYEPSMAKMLSAISPIDGEKQSEDGNLEEGGEEK